MTQRDRDEDLGRTQGVLEKMFEGLPYAKALYELGLGGSSRPRKRNQMAV